MENVINIGIPHVAEQIFEGLNTQVSGGFGNLEQPGWKCLDQKVERQDV